MVVIPYEKYLQLKANENKEMNSSIFSKKVDSENEANFINSSDKETQTKIDPDEKQDKVVRNTSDFDILDENDILEYIPKNYKNKCRLLLKHMRLHNLSWDAFGRLLVRDECLLDSHIVDLLRDVVMSYKRGCKGKHSHDFKKLLLATHCPHYLLTVSQHDDKKVIKKREYRFKEGIL